MRDGVITASFTAFQEKSSELGWEETQEPWLQDSHANVSVERGMWTEQLSTVGLKEPIQAVFFGHASKAAPVGKRRV